MIGRFGEVLYCFGLAIGALSEIAGWAIVIFSPGEAKFLGGALIILGFIIYGIGRACMYVLTGR